MKEGTWGPLNISLLADVTKSSFLNYGMLRNYEGIACRGIFIIDVKSVQIIVNDLLHEWGSLTSLGLSVNKQVWGSLSCWLGAWQWHHKAQCGWQQGKHIQTQPRWLNIREPKFLDLTCAPTWTSSAGPGKVRLFFYTLWSGWGLGEVFLIPHMEFC